MFQPTRRIRGRFGNAWGGLGGNDPSSDHRRGVVKTKTKSHRPDGLLWCIHVDVVGGSENVFWWRWVVRLRLHKERWRWPTTKQSLFHRQTDATSRTISNRAPQVSRCSNIRIERFFALYDKSNSSVKSVCLCFFEPQHRSDVDERKWMDGRHAALVLLYLYLQFGNLTRAVYIVLELSVGALRLDLIQF